MKRRKFIQSSALAIGAIVAGGITALAGKAEPIATPLRRVDIYRSGCLSGYRGTLCGGDYMEWNQKVLCKLADQPFSAVRNGDTIQVVSNPKTDCGSGLWYKVLENPLNACVDPAKRGDWSIMVEPCEPFNFTGWVESA